MMIPRPSDAQAAQLIIRDYLGTLDYAALTRVVNAERWSYAAFVADDGARCLISHAEPSETGRRHWPDDHPLWAVVGAYDLLARPKGWGLPKTVSAIKLLAAVLLREQEEAVVCALLQPAFCPLAAREESLR